MFARARSGHRRPRLRDVCGEDPGFICREIFERTEDRALAEIADKVLGDAADDRSRSCIVALIVNRLVGRAVKRALRTLHSGAVRERLGVGAPPHAGGAAGDRDVRACAPSSASTR